MKKFLSGIWKFWKEFAHAMGDIVSSIFLTIFYYSFFAVFALPYRLIKKGSFVKSSVSSWALKTKQVESIKDLEKEF